MTIVIAQLQKGQKKGATLSPKLVPQAQSGPLNPTHQKKMLSLYSNSERAKPIITIISFEYSKKLPNRWNLD